MSQSKERYPKKYSVWGGNPAYATRTEEVDMKAKGSIENARRAAALCGVASAVALAAAFAMSFLAEPLEQEAGYGTTMLGYNRDFLVNGRWYFFTGIIVSLMLVFHSFKKTNDGK